MSTVHREVVAVLDGLLEAAGRRRRHRCGTRRAGTTATERDGHARRDACLPASHQRLPEVEERVRLVPEGEPGLAEVDVPVAADGGVVLLHAVVGDEHERGVVEHAGLLDRVEHLAEAGVGVADRRRRDLRVRTAFVHRGVGEREVAPT